MPSANGVYSLPVGYLAVTGATIQASQHNPPLEDIATALTGRLSRDGTAPMTGPVQLLPGTVTVPGAVFSTDPSSGFYKTTAGIGVSIAGTKVAEFVAGGVNGARFLGELIPYTCTVAPALTVLPFGQTLSRVTYAALWVQAQLEITAGNTLYNNGDGSTTFGIPDMRGRVSVGWDIMGGSAAGRVTTAGSGVNGAVLGTAGGLETETLTLAQTPAGIQSGGAISVTAGGAIIPTTPVFGGAVFVPAGGGPGNSIAPTGNSWSQTSSLTGAAVLTSTNTGGGAHQNMQPSLICNYLLFAGA